MTYDEAMRLLNAAAVFAVNAADNEDGAPVDQLRQVLAEIECLIDNRCTLAELANAKALYEGAKRAGLTS